MRAVKLVIVAAFSARINPRASSHIQTVRGVSQFGQCYCPCSRNLR